MNNFNVPAASGAAPADDFRGDDKLLISCIVALLAMDADGSLVPHGVGGHARGLLSAAAARLDAALASREASLAPLTDERIDELLHSLLEGRSFPQDGTPSYWLTPGEIRELLAALASPQVALAPTNEWNDAIEAAAKRIENGSFLHDKSPAKLFAKEVAPVLRSMKRAAPASVAPQDDARDAAEVEGSSTVLFELVKWSEEAVKLLRSKDHEVRDRLRSALNALSTPAAKPIESI